MLHAKILHVYYRANITWHRDRNKWPFLYPSAQSADVMLVSNSDNYHRGRVLNEEDTLSLAETMIVAGKL